MVTKPSLQTGMKYIRYKYADFWSLILSISKGICGFPEKIFKSCYHIPESLKKCLSQTTEHTTSVEVMLLPFSHK